MISAKRMVEEQIKKALDFTGEMWKQEIEIDILGELEERESGEQKLGSPIEAVFLVWWMALEQLEGGSGHHCPIYLLGQSPVVSNNSSYWLDFCVTMTDTDVLFYGHKQGISFPKIAVELDGHIWHERTPEQVELRNRRDRDLQSDGWKIFHFSGREVLRDGYHCAQEVFEFSLKAENDFQHACRPWRLFQ